MRRKREGRFYAFYDANQNIHGGGPPGALQVLETRLVYNCRNTTRIPEYAAGLVGGEPHVRAGAPQGQPVIDVEGELTGGDVLPGFRCAAGRLFP